MFRLLYLKLVGHPQLGNLELHFVENTEAVVSKKPYSTVIIGPNGTGKSFILKTIGDIFRQFKDYQQSEKKEFKLPFTFHLRYKDAEDTYDIITQRKTGLAKLSGRKEYWFFKNKPRGTLSDELSSGAPSDFEIPLKELSFPDNVIVTSILLNDRFTFVDSKPDDFYQYMGVRRTRSISSTATVPKKTVRYLFDSSRSRDFLDDVREMMELLGFERHFIVQYKKRYKKIFFTGKLEVELIDQFFTRWWEVTGRRRERVPYSAPVYEKLKRERPNAIEAIVEFLNKLSNGDELIREKTAIDAKYVIVDLFEGNIGRSEQQLIEDLVKLDILSLEEIKVRKKEKEFTLEQTSSGESHLIISLLGLYSKVQPKSLILIDEPEVSLHPNWQMRYIHFVKQMFRKYPGSHFIIASHSHFIVSDLEGPSSSVISLSRDEKTDNTTARLLEGRDTYGWSAEEVLYSIFHVGSVRNYVLEQDVTKLLGMIGQGSREKDEMLRLIERLEDLELADNDPLKEIVLEAREYLGRM